MGSTTAFVEALGNTNDRAKLAGAGAGAGVGAGAGGGVSTAADVVGDELTPVASSPPRAAGALAPAANSTGFHSFDTTGDDETLGSGVLFGTGRFGHAADVRMPQACLFVNGCVTLVTVLLCLCDHCRVMSWT